MSTMSTLLQPVTGSPRRRVAVVVLTPVLAAVLLAAAGLGLPALSGVWLLLVAVAAILGAAVLATYVPHRGLRPEVGCTPCAAMSAMTVVGAVMALRSYGPDLTGPALAIAVTLFGLTQRLGQVDSCATAGTTPQPQTRREG
jgi:hypothetical protein